MAHGDYLHEEKKRVRDAILDGHDAGLPLRRAIAVALENMNAGPQEACGVEHAMKEAIKEHRA